MFLNVYCCSEVICEEEYNVEEHVEKEIEESEKGKEEFSIFCALIEILSQYSRW